MANSRPASRRLGGGWSRYLDRYTGTKKTRRENLGALRNRFERRASALRLAFGLGRLGGGRGFRGGGGFGVLFGLGRLGLLALRGLAALLLLVARVIGL